MLATRIVDHPIGNTELVPAAQIGHSLRRVNVRRWPHLSATVTMANCSMVDQIAPMMLSMRPSIDVCNKFKKKKKTGREMNFTEWNCKFAIIIRRLKKHTHKIEL